MKSSYDLGTQYLMAHGWKKQNPASFEKHGFTIVWDTSHFVELYTKVDSRRIDERRIESLEDLLEFLNRNNL